MAEEIVDITKKVSDSTKTKTWKKLEKERKHLDKINLRDEFANDPNRAKDLSFECGPLYIDLSKNRIKNSTLDLFAELAEEINLKEYIEGQFTGKHMNNTEDRAVL
ncbi:MAG: hypothetical protein LBM13_00810, partial [Candidatus Ancillula sp.]|nr:hypothetical protein [Candidatus Ancillula sp.]